MKKQISGLVLALALMGLAPATAAAAEVNMSSNVMQAECTTGHSSSRGGAAALAGLIAVLAAVPADVDVVACNILNNSLNNLLQNALQNADVHVIENILNNSPILSGFTIDNVSIVDGGIQISVLGGPIINLR